MESFRVDYEQPFFFLDYKATRARHVNDHARDLRRETGDALFSSRAAELVSRVSCARALPSLNLKKRERLLAV